MATIYDSRFNLDAQLKALGFIPQNSNKEKEDVYQATHLGTRYERHITVYIHYDAPIFLNEVCVLLCLYMPMIILFIQVCGRLQQNNSIIYFQVYCLMKNISKNCRML